MQKTEKLTKKALVAIILNWMVEENAVPADRITEYDQREELEIFIKNNTTKDRSEDQHRDWSSEFEVTLEEYLLEKTGEVFHINPCDTLNDILHNKGFYIHDVVKQH
jgi:hypothetical protein